MRIAIAALFLLYSCLALSAEDATVSKKTGTDENTFLVKKRFAARGEFNFGVPAYQPALDWLEIKADETCPAGYDKLGESVRKEEAKAYLIWEIRCITPATPEAKVPAEK